MKLLTTYEAAEKYRVPIRTLRQWLKNKAITRRFAKISKSRSIYLIDEVSLKKYLKNRPKPGRPPAK